MSNQYRFLLYICIGVLPTLTGHNSLLATPRQTFEIPSHSAIVPPALPPPEFHELPHLQLHRDTPPSLFNCTDCDSGRTRWFTDVNEVKRSAYFCGFDYLQVRFTQYFSDDSASGMLHVYGHSTPQYSIVIDSAVTSFKTPSDADRTVTVYHHPPRPLYLPIPSLPPQAPDPDVTIDAVAGNARTFSSHCRLKNDTPRDSWTFSVNGTTYLVEKDKLVIREQAPPHDRYFSGAIAYRLATWGGTPRVPSAFAADHSTPPRIVSLNINDSVSICRIRLECSSRYGLDYCVFSCGSTDDTVSFSGKEYARRDFVLNARPDDSLFALDLVDIHGNRSVRSVPLFAERRVYQRQWAEKRTFELLTRERAARNPVTAIAYTLSKFAEEPAFGLHREPDGSFRPEVRINPVSTLLKTIFRKKTEKYFAGVRNFDQPETGRSVSFPLPGSVNTELFKKGNAAYTTGFFFDRCSYGGSRITRLVNPSLERGAGQQDAVTFNLSAPLAAGKRPFYWTLDTTAPVLPPSSALLVCNGISVAHGDITLREFPCYFKRPSRDADFAVFHTSRHAGTDTLTVTYRICYCDRTSELIWQQILQGISYVNLSTAGDARTVETSPRIVTRPQGNRCLLLNVHVKGSKSIFRVDTFVHSRRQNQVIGWGVASLPG